MTENANQIIDTSEKGDVNIMSPRLLITEELAALMRVKPATIRHGYCLKGHYMGMRPAVKLPNRRLLWDAEQAVALLNG